MDSYLELLSGQNVDSNEAFWDGSQFASPQEEQDCQELTLVEGNPSVKPSKKRTKNFSEKEDIMLVSAWLQISMDVVHGNEQSRSTYWQRIHECFHQHKDFHSDRTCNSLMHRWSAVQESVNKFYGCFAQIQNRRQSGLTEQDKVQQACEVYKSKEKNGKSFGLLHCWNVLQHEQKWKNRCSQKKQKACSNASSGPSTPGSNESCHDAGVEGLTPDSPEEEQRPPGKKREKERERRGKSSVSSGDNLYMEALENMWARKKEAEALKEIKKKERNDEILAIEKKRLELVERDIELRQRIEDDKVMNMDLSGMSERQQQYYMRMQDEIIARRFGAGSS
ncbi:glutathione S-transferase T3-like isoform X1 [Phragmites australis]|uniref:glutathione S-transferase T3-like isoform X1 n=1 Tax=Phragmites australis TaxID=29695 RepID=UPI002D78AAF3|nr:glutathione S-transferase T3-like isoform X1 [Phragmites australis]